MVAAGQKNHHIALVVQGADLHPGEFDYIIRRLQKVTARQFFFQTETHTLHKCSQRQR